MALVFLDRYLMVYKTMNARGAHSLNIFPCFAVDILEMKPETETMVNSYFCRPVLELNSKLPNSGILSKTQFQLNGRLPLSGSLTEFLYHSVF